MPNTNEVAPAVITVISSSSTYTSAGIQPLTAVTTAGVTSRGYCAGNLRYSFVQGRMLSDDNTQHGLVADRLDQLPTPLQCSTATPALDLTAAALPSTARELLAPRMRVSYLSILSPTDISRLYRLHIRLVTGPDDVLDDKLDSNGLPGAPDGVLDTCNGVLGGSQYCAAVELTTTVQKRLQ